MKQKKNSDKPENRQRQKAQKMKKKKIRQEKEDQRGGKGTERSAGLQGEAALQRRGKVSEVIPLNHTGSYRKEGQKGRQQRKSRRR